MRWIARYGFVLLLVTISCCQLVLGCTGGAQQISICLHTYLERDFMEVEPFLELTDTQIKRILISGPEVDSLCHKFKTMVDCYAELDGQCFELQERRRFSHLLHTLITFHQTMCSHDLKIKYFLEHIACIARIQQKPKGCKVQRIVPNVWQKMLRLEETQSETCPSLQEQLTCIKEKQLLKKPCTAAGQALYESTMKMWLDGWCEGYSSASKLSAGSFGLLVFGLLYQLFQR